MSTTGPDKIYIAAEVHPMPPVEGELMEPFWSYITVAQLIEKLSQLDPNLKVFRGDSEYGAQGVESVYADKENVYYHMAVSRKVQFIEEDVVVIS